MTIRRRVYVSGSVQGVFFRATCRDEAVARGVSGYASNLPDGRVEAIFEGDEGPVQSMIDWCHRGSDYADVRSVEVVDEEPEGLSGFDMR